MKFIYIFFLMLISTLVSLAQVNLKVGYLGLRGDFENTNNIFKTFDENNTLSKNFGKVHYLQGIDIGVRYKWNRIGIETGWSNIQSRKIEAIGDNFQDDWKISSSEFYFGIENYFGMFGFGASVGYNTLRYKTNIPGTRDDQTIIKDNLLSSKIYILTTVTSGKTAISIKPYYMPKWGQVEINDLNSILNNDSSSVREFLTGFGFTLVLYNGPQD